MELHDENGNKCDGPFLVPIGSISGPSRTLKRTKSVNSPRIPRIDLLSPAPSPEEISGHESSTLLPICIRRSCRLTYRQPSPCGSFEQLPTELVYYILTYLPLTSIGQLGQTSKSMRDILIRWTSTTRMHDRLIQSVLQQTFATKDVRGRLYLARELHTECRRAGVLIKQLTCLFPSCQRLGLYYQLTNEVKAAILQRKPCYSQHIIAAAAGIILHSMISGWDKAECIKVYTSVCQWDNIGTLMSEYIKSPEGSANENVEKSLRMYLRSYFLDYCSPPDRSIWMGIVFDGPEMSSSHTNISKLLLLLYTPTDPRDNVMWDFYEEDMDFSTFTEEYKMIAEAIGYLILPSRRSYSPDEIVDLIQTITRLPTHWPTRAVSSLLLCLHCFDSKPVTTYFKYLSTSEQMGLAIELLADTIYVAGDFILSQPVENSLISNRSVLNLIRNAINCGWSHEDRRTIVEDIWDEIRELAVNLLDEARLIGNTEDLHNLMETWKEICVQLTF